MDSVGLSPKELREKDGRLWSGLVLKFSFSFCLSFKALLVTNQPKCRLNLGEEEEEEQAPLRVGGTEAFRLEGYTQAGNVSLSSRLSRCIRVDSQPGLWTPKNGRRS